eukprot:11165025-Lingulodinium_polyedra.AAC.1
MAPPPGPSGPGCPIAVACALASLGASSSDQNPGSVVSSARPLGGKPLAPAASSAAPAAAAS